MGGEAAPWDPRICPACGWQRSSIGEATECSSCGHAWSAAEEVCPLCGGAEYEEADLAAEIYDRQPDGVRCGDCGKKWQAGRPRDRAACPDCSSPNVLDSYPEIPSLDHDPLLALVLDVESQIPRTEGGVLMHREMVAWLRFHGVRDRAEMLTWESFFREIGSIRARIVEEMTAPAPGRGREEEREE